MKREKLSDFNYIFQKRLIIVKIFITIQYEVRMYISISVFIYFGLRYPKNDFLKNLWRFLIDIANKIN